MDLVKKFERSIVGTARPREFFGFEEGLHDSGVKLKPRIFSCERCECPNVPLVFVGDCFEVRGKVFKGVVAHVSNRSPPDRVKACVWRMSSM